MIIKDLARWIRYVLLFELRGLGELIVPSENIKELQKLKKSNTVKRCFIVATGPSLKIEDVECLKNEVTFGVNSIFLIYEKTTWRPTHYVCTDDGYFKRMLEEYDIDILGLARRNIFLNKKNRNILKKYDSRIRWLRFSRWNRAVDFKWTRYRDDISTGMYAFGTVTNIAIAIAIFMGYTDIYLLGCDCSNLNHHVVNDVSDNDKSDDKAKQIQNVQLKGYRKMKKIADERGIHIYNSTRGGALEEFERVNFDELFEREGEITK